VSAGIDMALALIARLNGRDMAVAAARNMEYVWHEKADDDPFA
jgi:transcriptional regulator GlxA family with amidase domain